MTLDTLRPLDRRSNAIFAVADQAVSSLGNFIVVVIAARLLNVEQFGAYSIAYVVVTLLLSCNQALVGQAVVLAEGGREKVRREGRESLAFSFVAGSVTAVLLAVVAVLLPTVRSELLVVSAALPMLLVQDTMRHVAAAMRSCQHALAIDGMWLAGSCALIAALGASGFTFEAWHLILLWVLPGALSGFWGLASFRPWAASATDIASKYLRSEYLGLQFLFELVVARAAAQAMVVGVAPFAGLAASGALRGVTTLFGPLNILITTMTSFGPPLISDVPRQRRNTFLWIMGATTTAVAVGATGVLALLPSAWGTAILGDTWVQASTLVVPTGVLTIAAVVATVGILGLRVIAPRKTFVIRTASAALIVPGFVCGYLIEGIAGAAWGLSVPVVIQAGWAVASYVSADRSDAATS